MVTMMDDDDDDDDAKRVIAKEQINKAKESLDEGGALRSNGQRRERECVVSWNRTNRLDQRPAGDSAEKSLPTLN